MLTVVAATREVEGAGARAVAQNYNSNAVVGHYNTLLIENDLNWKTRIRKRNGKKVLQKQHSLSSQRPKGQALVHHLRFICDSMFQNQYQEFHEQMRGHVYCRPCVCYSRHLSIVKKIFFVASALI